MFFQLKSLEIFNQISLKMKFVSEVTTDSRSALVQIMVGVPKRRQAVVWTSLLTHICVTIQYWLVGWEWKWWRSLNKFQ